MNPIIAVTMGDPAGIGPEIVAKVFSDSRIYSFCKPFVIGNDYAMKMGMKVAGSCLDIRLIKKVNESLFKKGTIDLLNLNNVRPSELIMGVPHPMTGKASVEYVLKAAELAMKERVNAIVTAPINKEAINMAGYRYAGHTELLAEKTGIQDYAMMLISGNLRVIHVTTHIPLRDVSKQITKERVFKTIKIAQQAATSLGISSPRIAVSGLNPHSSDGGLFGNEEKMEIQPAIEEAKKFGMNVEGPISPDTVFGKALGGLYDMVVVMYHDQGHIPVKLLGFKWNKDTGEWGEISGVNTTIGLPFIRTSVDHGTAYGKAGRREGTANPQSLLDAIEIAAKMAQKEITKKSIQVS
jgi:4-hydroxythreonine-4-phosphate dehydrogenase